MQCPKCGSNLKRTSHKGIEVDYCSECEGMWLDLDELDQLEDVKLDADELKGTLVFSSSATEHHCPHCGKALKRFQYRLHTLELEYCEDHGFWLDDDEEKRVLELMEERSKDMRRKFKAEAEWQNTLRKLKSRSFLSKLGDLFK